MSAADQVGAVSVSTSWRAGVLPRPRMRGHRDRWRCRGGAAGLMVSLIALAMAACVSATPTEDREAAVYVEVVRWFLSDVASETPVFLDHREDVEIDLAVQAAVVERLEVFQSVRFIDSLSEASDETEPGSPVRDDGVFLRLGSLEGDDAVSLTVSRYVSTDEVEAYRFTLRVVGDQWEIQGFPTPAQSER